jgi:chorismate mutase
MSQESISTPNITDRRRTIDQIDAQIIGLAKERTRESQAIVAERTASGGPRIVQKRERDVISNFEKTLGEQGIVIAMALLALGRGTLHHEPESE